MQHSSIILPNTYKGQKLLNIWRHGGRRVVAPSCGAGRPEFVPHMILRKVD